MDVSGRIRTALGARAARVFMVVLVSLLWGLPVTAQDHMDSEAQQAPALLEMLQRAMVQIQQTAGHAVVSIKTESHTQPLSQLGKEAPQHDTPHRGVGSGVIVDAHGIILTNYHVVERADNIEVTLYDGKTLPGTVIGRDAKTDLAVVKVDSTEALPVAVLGDSNQVQVGQWAAAIGDPFGLGQSLTVGVISGLGRDDLGLATFENYIQTDASINPGNSGGPLLNIRGEVIGINTAINPIGRGIGFAIPINQARAVMQQLIAHGRVVRGFLGLVIQPLSAELAAKFDVDDNSGVLVSDIIPGSPAAQAGLQRGDVILSFAGQPIHRVPELQRLAAETHPGTPVQLKVVRDRREQLVALEIGEAKDSEPQAEPAGSRFGLTLDALTTDLAKQFNVKRDQGVIITNVENGGPGARDGLRKGDVIVEIERNPVANLDAFREAVSKLDPNDDILLLISRGGRSFYTILHAPQG